MIRIVAVLMALTGGAQAADCRLALLLALDVSSSVDAAEDHLQRGGLARALQDPAVVEAFFASDLPVALGAYEWSGKDNQVVVLDWVVIATPDDLAQAAAVVAGSTRAFQSFPTAMGHALEYGAAMMARAPRCLAQVIDMAGDGQSNDGPGPAAAYRAAGFAQITVNGLVVNAADFEGEVGLIAFYQGEVLHGPGAFMIVADGFEDYARAMRDKLVREVSPVMLGAVR